MKKLTTAVVSAIAYLSFASPIFAATGGGTGGGAGSVNVDLCPSGSFSGLCSLFSSGIGTIITNLIIIAIGVAIIASLFFLIYGGIRWITSGGDEKQVEAAKNHVVAAIVGLVIALAAFFILQFITSFFGLGSLTNFTLPTLNGT